MTATSGPQLNGHIDVQSIKDKTNLLDLIGRDTTLKKVSHARGGEYAGACPFCGGTDRFRVQPEQGQWWCRQCSGDSKWQDCIAYVQLRDHVSFREAAQRLAGGAVATDVLAPRPARPVAKTPEPAPERTTRYEYRDGAGVLVAIHERLDYADRPKKFRWLLPDGTVSSGHIKSSDVPLYGLADVLAAPADEWIIVCEGEKARDAVKALGFTATCLGGGSSQTDFGASLAPLHGRKVALWADADEPGRKYMALVERALAGKARRLRMLEVPGIPAKGDAAEYRADGRTADELRGLLDRPRAADRLISAAELLRKEYPPLRPVIDKLVYSATSILLSGRSKDGKSMLALGLALARANGTKALGSLATQAGPVLYLCLEDGERRAQDRLRNMLSAQGMTEADIPASLQFAFSWPRLDEGGLDDLQEWAETHPDGMIVVDLLERVRPARGASVYESDYKALSGLNDLAHQTATTVIIVSHNNKLRGGDVDPLDLISGSMGLPGAVDAAIVFRPRQHGATEAVLATIHRDAGRKDWTICWDEYLAGWRFVGEALVDGAARPISPERQELLAALAEGVAETGRGLLPVELAERVGKAREAVRYLLHKMRGAGEVHTDAENRHYPANTPNTPNTPQHPNGPNRADQESEGPVSDPLLAAPHDAPNRATAPAPDSEGASVGTVWPVRGVSGDTGVFPIPPCADCVEAGNEEPPPGRKVGPHDDKHRCGACWLEARSQQAEAVH